ncbi:hypothetical protein DFH09DRAFT_1089119 [Mycena vulgaris]|nr:hypothetical protein DFH09DRAFT_1089119 [Mycena vulgaris]
MNGEDDLPSTGNSHDADSIENDFETMASILVELAAQEPQDNDDDSTSPAHSPSASPPPPSASSAIANPRPWPEARRLLLGRGVISPASESMFNYTSRFANIPGTTLNMSVPALLNVAAATLEAYNITALSDYPAGATVFSGINVEFASGETKPDAVWRPVGDTVDGLGSTVDRDGAVDAQITVKY